jgi:tetratricopeptide (TPR) repeat protein
LAAEHPEVPNYRRGLGEGLTYVAFNLMNRGAWEEARPLLERAVASQKAAFEINPQDLDYRGSLNGTLRYLTEVYVALGDQQAAARTADDFANNILRETVDAAGAVVSPAIMAAIYCETLIDFGMPEIQDPDNCDAQRREPSCAAHLLIAKTLIQRAVERTSDDPLQYQIADILTTAPAPLRDPELALKVARRAVELKPGEAMCMQSLGWALYRCGDWKGCIEILKSIAVERPGTDEQRFVSAMAYWQLGEKTEARANFDSASEWLKGYEQKCDETRKKYRKMYPPVSLEKRLQAEAAALLGVTLPAVEPAPAPAAKEEEAKELPKSTPAPEAAKEEETSNK